jgi:hypothetical protein
MGVTMRNQMLVLIAEELLAAQVGVEAAVTVAVEEVTAEGRDEIAVIVETEIAIETGIEIVTVIATATGRGERKGRVLVMAAITVVPHSSRTNLRSNR